MNTHIQDEIKRYKELVKKQEKQIKVLTSSNKHIKTHIKYLEDQLPSAISVIENEIAASDIRAMDMDDIRNSRYKEGE